MNVLYPILQQRVKPFFLGKDARNLDTLIDGVYLYRNNYKLQNLALWVPVATVEIAVLDMLGRIAGKPIGALLGDVLRTRIGVYRANNCRGKSAEESIEIIRRTQEETGAKAVKFKVGGRMAGSETPPGRTEALIPMLRKYFDDDIQIYADANGSYGREEAIRIGNLLREHRIDVFEEAVPFDRYETMKEVSKALEIKMASGGGEASFNNVRWMIAHKVFQIYQMDPFYFGGMIRCIRTARMAEAAGCTYQPHISGTGLGYVYMMHLVSAVTNPEKYHEFKGLPSFFPFSCGTSDLAVKDGMINVPTGPGSGVEIDPGYLQEFSEVSE
jgi:L-alanine-DL-glutamate epimerase-like enolase superfamily enzyme